MELFMEGAKERWGKREILTKRSAYAFLHKDLSKLDQERRARLTKDVSIFLSEDQINLTEDGRFEVARYDSFGNTITIFVPLIWNRNHLRDVLVHELGHRMGLTESEIVSLEKEKRGRK